MAFAEPAGSGRDPLSFFDGGGELGALCRQKDWSQTSLGPAQAWPQSLKTAVGMTLTSTFPSIVLWGPELIQIYNDAYRLIMGKKHPGGLGQRTRECWPEAWHINAKIYPRVFAGETISYKEAVYPLEPNGVLEDYYLTLCYNPIRAEDGGVGGVLVTFVDVTNEIKARRERDRAYAEAETERKRLREVFMQAPAVVAVLEGPEHRFTVANDRYRQLVGGRDVVGKTIAEALPEVVEQGFTKLLDQVRETGQPFVAHDMLVRLDRRGSGQLEDIYADFIYQPLFDINGAVFGVMAHAVETTEQVLARRRIEMLAAEREAMLSQIADGIITYDREGRVTFINQAALELMPNLMVGKSFTEQREAVSVLQLDGTPFPADGSPSGRALRGERVVDVEWLSVVPGKGTLRLAGSAIPVVDSGGQQIGIIVTCRDVTEKHRLQSQIEFERNRLSAIFRQAPAAITIVRASDLRIESANDLVRQMFGDRELVGRTLREAFPEVEQQGYFELFQQVIDSKQALVGNELPGRYLRDGREVEGYFNFVYQPILDQAGEVVAVMSHSIEVTEVVRARQQAEQRAAELVRLTAALEQSNHDLDQFAYVASHDLKAPLRGIANLAQWVIEDAGETLTAEAKEHLGLLMGRVHRMEALIDGILAYSRAGRTRDPVTDVDTAALVREVVELLAPPANVTVDVAPGLPGVRAERVPLQQVFLNLIGNAVKFAGRGEGAARIVVAARDAGDAWEFSVADNGPGIAPEFHDRVWGIFQTLESRDRIEGTGIGLSVVKKIVETRGGRVSLESSSGAGATFRFTLPKSVAPAQ